MVVCGVMDQLEGALLLSFVILSELRRVEGPSGLRQQTVVIS